jgi:hypothetical protein
MWRRFRRRTFAPRRPLIFPEQIGIVMVTALFILGGAAVVVWALTSQ